MHIPPKTPQRTWTVIVPPEPYGQEVLDVFRGLDDTLFDELRATERVMEITGPQAGHYCGRLADIGVKSYAVRLGAAAIHLVISVAPTEPGRIMLHGVVTGVLQTAAIKRLVRHHRDSG